MVLYLNYKINCSELLKKSSIGTTSLIQMIATNSKYKEKASLKPLKNLKFSLKKNIDIKREIFLISEFHTGLTYNPFGLIQKIGKKQIHKIFSICYSLFFKKKRFFILFLFQLTTLKIFKKLNNLLMNYLKTTVKTKIEKSFKEIKQRYTKTPLNYFLEKFSSLSSQPTKGIKNSTKALSSISNCRNFYFFELFLKQSKRNLENLSKHNSFLEKLFFLCGGYLFSQNLKFFVSQRIIDLERESKEVTFSKQTGIPNKLHILKLLQLKKIIFTCFKKTFYQWIFLSVKNIKELDIKTLGLSTLHWPSLENLLQHPNSNSYKMETVNAEKTSTLCFEYSLTINQSKFQREHFNRFENFANGIEKITMPQFQLRKFFRAKLLIEMTNIFYLKFSVKSFCKDWLIKLTFQIIALGINELYSIPTNLNGLLRLKNNFWYKGKLTSEASLQFVKFFQNFTKHKNFKMVFLQDFGKKEIKNDGPKLKIQKLTDVYVNQEFLTFYLSFSSATNFPNIYTLFYENLNLLKREQIFITFREWVFRNGLNPTKNLNFRFCYFFQENLLKNNHSNSYKKKFYSLSDFFKDEHFRNQISSLSISETKRKKEAVELNNKSKILLSPIEKLEQLKDLKRSFENLKKLIKNSGSQTQLDLIRKITPEIYALSYFYLISFSSKTKDLLDPPIFQYLWQWACRRHPNKSKTWIQRKYFSKLKYKKWVFGLYAPNSNTLLQTVRFFYLPSISQIFFHLNQCAESSKFQYLKISRVSTLSNF